MTYTRLQQLCGNIHKSNNDNNMFIGLHKTIQKKHGRR
jgi:hypothetical protein